MKFTVYGGIIVTMSVLLSTSMDCRSFTCQCIKFHKGLKLQFQLLNTEAFRRIGAELSPHGLPGNYKGALYSTEYLEKFVRSQSMIGHHPVGTCRMGSSIDNSAVVDTELKYVLVIILPWLGNVLFVED